MMNTVTAKLGFYSATVATIAVIGFGVVQILQIIGITTYPLDAILIYSSSLCIAPPYLIAVVALHYSVLHERKLFTHLSILFAAMYNVFVIIMYSVQLATVIPQSLYTPSSTILTDAPHSFFWTLDALGYISMGISTLFAAFAFTAEKHTWIRRFFIANGLMVPVISLVYFLPGFSYTLLLLASPWIVTTAGSLLLLAMFFKKQYLRIL